MNKSGLRKLIAKIRRLAKCRKRRVETSVRGESWTSYTTGCGQKVGSISYVVGKVVHIASTRSGTTGEISSATVLTPDSIELSIPVVGKLKVNDSIVVPYAFSV